MLSDEALAVGLSRLITDFSSADISDRATDIAKKCLADTLAVTLAGSSGPEASIVAKVHGSESGSAVVLGRSERMHPTEAALVIGTASHALDFDDFSGTLGGHHSAPVVSALLALGSRGGFSGADLLTAYVVGCEVTILLAPAVHPHHYDKGWHPTATLGVFGTTAACAKLLDLDAARTGTAIAIAASSASGLKANFGTMTKPLHVGLTARSGLMAALLAAEGFSANLDVFEHHQGFFEVFNGSGNYDSSHVLERFASPLKLEEDSISIKRYACCGSTHAAIDAALAVAGAPGHEPSAIRSVLIKLPVQRLRHTDRPRPATSLEGKFSVQYVTARALLEGAVKMTDFDPVRVTDGVVTDLLERVSAVGVDASSHGLSAWGAEVIVSYEDGREVVEKVRDVADQSGARQISWAKLEEKFFDCSSSAIGVDRAAELLAGIKNLEQVADMHDLIALTAR